MKKSVFAVACIIMIIIAVCFVAFALGHPEMSWPWPNSVTYVLYTVYAVVVVVFFVLAKK